MNTTWRFFISFFIFTVIFIVLVMSWIASLPVKQMREGEKGSVNLAHALLRSRHCAWKTVALCEKFLLRIAVPLGFEVQAERAKQSLRRLWQQILANRWPGQKKRKKRKWSMVLIPSFQAPSMSSPLLAKPFSKRVIVNLELRYLLTPEAKILRLLFFL